MVRAWVATCLLVAAAAAAPVARIPAAVPAALPRVALPLRFDRSPTEMRATFETAKARLNAAADLIAKTPLAEARYADTVAPYAAALAEFGEATLPLTLLTDVSPDPDVRTAGKEISEAEQKTRIGLTAREDLYAVFSAAAAAREPLDEQDARLLEKTVEQFIGAGHGLPPAQRARLKAISERLATMTEEFEENIREDRGELAATAAELAGVPDDVLSSMKRAPDGRYLVSLDMATYMAVMTSAKDADLRRRLELADQRRTVETNVPLLQEGLALRAEAAGLRGFATFAHMAIDGAMAETPEKVARFLGRAREAITGRAERDRAELLARKRVDHPAARRLESWDRPYYEEALRRERFGVDPDVVRRYFPLERTVFGVLRVYERLLGVSFQPVDDAPVWHPEVRAFDAYDAKSGLLLGRVYLDLVSRDDKYGFAAMQPVVNGRVLPDGTYRAPTATIMASFPRPAPDNPSFLTHADVETMFHEMGHVMHELLTEARHTTMAGSEVAMDFAEMPSQIMENLAWDRSVLTEISGRPEDGAPLPSDLIDRMLAARAFQRGLFYLRQLAFALVDQSLHAAVPVDVVAAANKVIEEVMGFKIQEGAAPIASYEYMFGGYEAFYYGYAWSEVYSEDAWSRFKREGIFSPAVGADLRREILSRGAGRPEADSLEAFLGRKPSLEAFIAKLMEEPAMLAPLAAAVVVVRPGAPAASLPAGPAHRWNLTPQEMRHQFVASKHQLDAALAGIASVPAVDARFVNTVLAYERAQAVWVQEWLPLRFLSEVSPDPAVRDAARAIQKRVDAISIELGQREDLYRLFEAAAAKGEALSEADARLLEGTLRGFRKNGMGLAAAERAKLKALQQRLADVANRFEQNVTEHVDFLELTAAQVAGLGLPPDYVASLPRSADGATVRVGLDYPSYMPFMRYASDARLRRALREKFERRAPANLPLAQETLELRRDLATMLGEPSFPALALQDRMAKTPEAVMAFLERVKQAVLPRSRAELAELLALKRRDDPTARRIEAEDIGYYARKLREERHALDGDLVKQYFPVDRVIEGTLRVYQRVLGVSLREVEGGARWHPDVRLFEISDADGRRVGHFYLDLHPRANKYGHAAAFPLSLGMEGADGRYSEPVAAMVANFPKAAPGKPALLPFGDVETFFHEFGHIMHQTLTKARHASQSGSSVATDFVEGPSQMLEEFVWNAEVVAELSGHWETGAALPAELFAKMRAARSVLSAVEYAYQVGLAAADFALHLSAPADPSAVYDKIVSDMTGIDIAPGDHPLSAFSHLIGYEGGYYGYLWSKVFALDMFSRFAAEGVLSAVVGGDYRRHVLETGSSRPEMDSLRAFLGREPSEDAFARELEAGPAPSNNPPLSFPELADLAQRHAAVYDAIHAAGGTAIVSLKVNVDEGDGSIPVWPVAVYADTPDDVLLAVRAAMEPLPGRVRVVRRPAVPLS